MSIFAWTVTAVVVLLLLSFVGYLVSLRRLPTAERTDVRIYDRFGSVKEIAEPDRPARE